MLSVFLGILVATLLMSAAPVYLDALERQSIKGAIDQQVSRWGGSFFDIAVESRFVPLDSDEFERSDLAHGAAFEEHAAPVIAEHSPFRTHTVLSRAGDATAASSPGRMATWRRPWWRSGCSSTWSVWKTMSHLSRVGPPRT